MKAANVNNIDALQMQIVRLVSGITDKNYLLEIRDALQAKFGKDSLAVEVSEIEMEAIKRGLRDLDEGRVHSTEEVQKAVRAKLKH